MLTPYAGGEQCRSFARCPRCSRGETRLVHPYAAPAPLRPWAGEARGGSCRGNACAEMILRSIHHVAIICSDYQISKQFYVEILGLRVIREVYRAERKSWKCDLALAGFQIELFSFPDPPRRPSTPEACGLRHLAFAVTELEPVIKHLEAAGVYVEPIRTDEHTKKRFTFFADPDALPLELYEK